MSFGDSFANEYRKQLAEAIEREKTSLVSLTSERRAGNIQGMMNALALADSVYQQINTERVPSDRQTTNYPV